MSSSRLLAAFVAMLAVSACGVRDDAPTPVQLANAPPATDIWSAEILDSGRRLRLGKPVNLTVREGYDNQPHFLPDGSGFLYTVIGDDGQADIWYFDLERNRRRQLTNTPEAEFSPTPLPDGGFAVVRVEEDGRQRLWRFDATGRAPRLILESVEPVGYMAWMDDRRVALFVLGEPHTLVFVDVLTGESSEVLRSVGRSLHPVPGRVAVSVVHKASEDEWNIVQIEPGREGVTILAPALAPAEDFAWTPDGQLLMARGARVFVRRPGEGQEWTEIADFAEAGIAQISRVAVSLAGDRLLFVVQTQ